VVAAAVVAGMVVGGIVVVGRVVVGGIAVVVAAAAVVVSIFRQGIIKEFLDQVSSEDMHDTETIIPSLTPCCSRYSY
jgi:hypothetical protein